MMFRVRDTWDIMVATVCADRNRKFESMEMPERYTEEHIARIVEACRAAGGRWRVADASPERKDAAILMAEMLMKEIEDPWHEARYARYAEAEDGDEE